MSKKKLVIIILATVAVLLLSTVLFFLLTKGTIEEKDGLMQNLRVYIDDVTLEDGDIYYVLKNDTPFAVETMARAALQKKKQGEWKYCDNDHMSFRDEIHTVKGFGERSCVLRGKNLYPGEYRLVFGEYNDLLEEDVTLPEDALFIVGYFNIEKPAVTEYGKFYTEDGVLQNTHVTLTIETEDLQAPLTSIRYTLHDDCDFYVELDLNSDEAIVEICENGVWREVPHIGKYRENKNEIWISYDKSDFDPFAREAFTRNTRFYSPRPATDEDLEGHFEYFYLEPGQYRIRVKYTLYTDEEVEIPDGRLDAVAYFTVTAPVE